MRQLTEEETSILRKFGIPNLEALTNPHTMYELLREFDRFGKVGGQALAGEEGAVNEFKTVLDLCYHTVLQYNWRNAEEFSSKYYLARGINEFGVHLARVLRAGVDNSSNERALELERRMFNPTNAIF